MRVKLLCAVLTIGLTACGVQQRQVDLLQQIAIEEHNVDNKTIAHFPHAKASDADECLSRANAIPSSYVYRRNNVLSACLSAADHRNQGL